MENKKDKDFDKWNKLKKKIHTNNENKFYHEREVWWCSFGENVGFEQDGKEAQLITSQIRLIDTKRLINKIGVVEKEIFEEVRKTVKGLL